MRSPPSGSSAISSCSIQLTTSDACSWIRKTFATTTNSDIVRHSPRNLSVTSRMQWQWRECDGDVVSRLAEAIKLPKSIARLLVQRGICEPEAAQRSEEHTSELQSRL